MENASYEATAWKPPGRYEKTRQLWQCVPFVTWDRVQAREPPEKHFFLSVPEPDAKKKPKPPIVRKYPRDDQRLAPDDELIELIREDKLAPMFRVPFPGYTGMTTHYDTSDRARVKAGRRLVEHATTTGTVHRPFPATVYADPAICSCVPDASRTVAVLYPNHPFRAPPARTGVWINPLSQPIW